MLSKVLKRYSRFQCFKPEAFATIQGSTTDLKVYDQKHKTRFYHSGDFGDIIYSLPTIRALGGGVLVLGPEIKIGLNVQTRLRFNRKSFDALAPLLLLQPYIHELEFAERMPPDIDIDLNLFRRYLLEEPELRRKGQRQLNLAEAHLLTFRQSLDACNTAWLVVDHAEPIAERPVLVHRSARWRNSDFPWRLVLNEHGCKAAFVGMKSEYTDFTEEHDVAIPHLVTADFLELARYIAGSSLYIGNQSAPYAIAEGLKKNTLLEVWPEGPNCIFVRDTAHYGDGKQVFIPKLITTMTQEIVKCPLCANEEATTVRTRADIVECTNCGLVYLRTRPSKASMEERYQTYAEGGSHMRLPLTIDEMRTSGLRRDYFMQQIIAAEPPSAHRIDSRFLDVGCGWGAFLANAREKGYQPSGVEICAKMANFASGVMGLEVEAKQLEDASFTGQFSVVSLLHVLEHLPSLTTAMQHIHSLLKPNGLFCGIVPNYASLCSTALKDKWAWLDPDMHYVYFTPDSLRVVLERFEFKVESITTHTGDFDVQAVIHQVKQESNLPMAPDEITARIEAHWAALRGEEIRFFARKA